MTVYYNFITDYGSESLYGKEGRNGFEMTGAYSFMIE